MLRLIRPKLTTIRLAAIAALLALSAPPAAAQPEPFKISGAGVAPEGLPLPGQPPREHWIVGNATHLGRHTGIGEVQTDSAAPVFDDGGNLLGFVGEFGSSDEGFVFTAADGDKLATHYGRTAYGASKPGKFKLTLLGVTDGGDLIVEALFIAEFVVDPEASTGRFEGVTGSWVMYARTGPFVLGSTDELPYEWMGKGQLTFPNQ